MRSHSVELAVKSMTSGPLSTAPLTSPFAAVGEDKWRALATAALKGKPFEKLHSESYDGVKIAPLYARREKASAQPRIAQPGAWAILGRVDAPNAKTANALLLEDLENGATGAQIVFAKSLGAYGFGLSAADLPAALENVYLEAGVAIELDGLGAGGAQAFADLVRARGLAPDSVDVSFGLDPIGSQIFGADAADFGAQAAALAKAGFKGPFFVADARCIHAAGGSEAQELAFALGAAAHALRAMERAGMSLEDAARAIAFRIAIDADEFLGVAKLRALRRLWSRAQEACGLAPTTPAIHAETAWRMTTRRDPYVNVLRGTIAAFSAAIGGADRISILPFTQALGLPDAFARRIARNSQLILLEESNIDKVADAAAGAGGFEALTDELCAAAWSLFQSHEKAGGVAAQSDALAQAVAATAQARRKNIERRKDPLTGASEFPDIHEKEPAVLHPIPKADDAHPLAARRLAEPFEALRDASDARARSGERPKIFLANLGPISAFTARATFAKNFFEAGGIHALVNDGFATPDALAQAFAESGAALVCLCSSDDFYAAKGAEALKALKDKGAKYIALAGRPADEAAMRAAGATDFVYAGCDAVSELKRAWAAL